MVVGVAGFEPATSWSQTRRDDRATLHPEKNCCSIRVQIYSGILEMQTNAAIILIYFPIEKS